MLIAEKEYETIACVCDSSDREIVRLIKQSDGVYHVERDGVIQHPTAGKNVTQN